MKLLKETLVACALTVAAFVTTPGASAHEIKVGDLVISHPWSRQSPMGADVSAGFMKITNTGKEDDKLVSATADIAPMVQIHEMKMVGDVMKMQEVAGGLVIPAGKTIELKPKSYHIMFMQVPKQPVVDTTFKGTLVFEKAGKVDIDYEVVDANATMDH
ncbi:MAG: copper chaperone PCu(A)C [Rhizobiales bacterium]|nr:copper chaperone PCu(A)C [Hyphomicrobiales bacterium]